MTTVTLHRQGDGTYKADSPHELMAFAQYSEHVFEDANGNLRDKLSLTALRATLESETAKDTRFEQGYVMPIK